jgi:hypothetical protein
MGLTALPRRIASAQNSFEEYNLDNGLHVICTMMILFLLCNNFGDVSCRIQR